MNDSKFYRLVYKIDLKRDISKLETMQTTFFVYLGFDENIKGFI